MAAPVIGAREQGAKGFVKGLGAGVVSAVALPVAGLVVGGVQLARGMANTPNAINEELKGRYSIITNLDLHRPAPSRLALTCTVHLIVPPFIRGTSFEDLRTF